MITPYLSIVIPSFDEMANLQKGVLDNVARFLDKKKIAYEVLVVDDGSTDGSIEFVERFIKENPSFKMIKNHHSGKAGAVTKGVLQAKGQYVLFTDMDQATPLKELDKLLPYFEKGYDVVIGSRAGYRKGAPLSRLIISRGFIVLRKLIVGMDYLTDTQCGFKMFTNEAAQRLFKRLDQLHNGFKNISGSAVQAGFDIELLYIAKKMKFKTKEVPVEWLYVETRRVSPLKDSIEGIVDLFHIKINGIRGIYNK